MNIVLYGGAFNPPTNAHLAIAAACAEEAARLSGELWLLPSGDRPDKVIAADPTLRRRLLDSFTVDIEALGFRPQIELSELQQHGLTETIDTVKRLSDRYPSHRFHWVFGADSIATMRTWGGGAWLHDNLEMLVVPRPGYALPPLPPKARLLAVQTQPVSSTVVRERLSNGLAVDHLVPPSVARVLDKLQA